MNSQQEQRSQQCISLSPEKPYAYYGGFKKIGNPFDIQKKPALPCLGSRRFA